MSAHPENDPTAVEPDEADLPDKPPIEAPDVQGDVGEEDVPDADVLSEQDADEDDTVDNAERPR